MPTLLVCQALVTHINDVDIETTFVTDHEKMDQISFDEKKDATITITKVKLPNYLISIFGQRFAREVSYKTDLYEENSGQ